MKTKEKEKSKIKLVEFDPWLEPYEDHIKTRISKYKKDRKKLLSDADDFTDFANGHLYFGFHRSNKGWYYREWAPGADSLHLIGEFNNWNPSSHPLTHLGNGYWEIFLDGKKSLWHECLVKVRVTKDNVSHDKIPLYIKRVIQDPNTHSFSGQIYCPEKDYKWMNPSFKIPKKQDLLIYEAHVGMAQEKEAIGSFSEFTNIVLPKIKEKGYNAVQLMAVMQHPYYASFGYHVSNFFAVSSWFGTPDELKILIDTAHSMDIAVLMDIVHSHAVKNTADGINEFDGTSYQFFHEGARGNHPAWDSKLFDYSKPEVIHFLLSNIKYWMDEYHFDGFRFDGITSMLYLDHGLGKSFTNYDQYFSDNTDLDAVTYLQFANALIKKIKPTAITIAEDMSGMPGMCLPISYGGLGFDYRLAMGLPDFWIRMLEQRDETWNMYTLWYEAVSKRPHEKRIGYCESHDQAMVGDKTIMFRLCDEVMYWHMHKSDNHYVIDRAIALHKLIRFFTLTAASEAYLNFMGNEFGHPEWIDFPREGNGWSYKYALRKWSLEENSELKYTYLSTFDRFMVYFAQNHDILKKSEFIQDLFIDDTRKLIVFKKQDLIFIFNFHPTDSYSDLCFPTKDSNSYKAIFDSDLDIFGGYNRVSRDIVYHSINNLKFNENCITIYSPSRTCIVLEKL